MLDIFSLKGNKQILFRPGKFCVDEPKFLNDTDNEKTDKNQKKTSGKSPEENDYFYEYMTSEEEVAYLNHEEPEEHAEHEEPTVPLPDPNSWQQNSNDFQNDKNGNDSNIPEVDYVYTYEYEMNEETKRLDDIISKSNSNKNENESATDTSLSTTVQTTHLGNKSSDMLNDTNASTTTTVARQTSLQEKDLITEKKIAFRSLEIKEQSEETSNNKTDSTVSVTNGPVTDVVDNLNTENNDVSEFPSGDQVTTVQIQVTVHPEQNNLPDKVDDPEIYNSTIEVSELFETTSDIHMSTLSTIGLDHVTLQNPLVEHPDLSTNLESLDINKNNNTDSISKNEYSGNRMGNNQVKSGQEYPNKHSRKWKKLEIPSKNWKKLEIPSGKWENNKENSKNIKSLKEDSAGWGNPNKDFAGWGNHKEDSVGWGNSNKHSVNWASQKEDSVGWGNHKKHSENWERWEDNLGGWKNNQESNAEWKSQTVDSHKWEEKKDNSANWQTEHLALNIKESSIESEEMDVLYDWGSIPEAAMPHEKVNFQNAIVR